MSLKVWKRLVGTDPDVWEIICDEDGRPILCETCPCDTTADCFSPDEGYVGTAIPDDDAVGVNLDIDVSGLSSAHRLLYVSVRIAHTQISDIKVTLTNPNATTVTLFDGPVNWMGCTGTGLIINYYPGTGHSPPDCDALDANGDYSADEDVGNLNDASDYNGTWTLNVSDNAAGTTGTIQSVSLCFSDDRVVLPGCPSGNDVCGYPWILPRVLYCNMKILSGPCTNMPDWFRYEYADGIALDGGPGWQWDGVTYSGGGGTPCLSPPGILEAVSCGAFPGICLMVGGIPIARQCPQAEESSCSDPLVIGFSDVFHSAEVGSGFCCDPPFAYIFRVDIAFTETPGYPNAYYCIDDTDCFFGSVSEAYAEGTVTGGPFWNEDDCTNNCPAPTPPPTSPESQFPEAAANDDSNGGTGDWSSTGNVFAEDDVGAALAFFSGTSKYLVLTDFGFSIPSGATIDGIEVRVRKMSQFGDIVDSEVKIVKGGIIGSTDYADTLTNWPSGSFGDTTYGGATDLWGETWTDSDINGSDFGVAIAADFDVFAPDGYIDTVEINVYFTV